MTRNELIKYAEHKGHEIIFLELEANEALSTEIDGSCYIGIDTLVAESDELELIAHELAHCEYAGFYSRLTPLNTRARIEYRAKKWQFLKLIPLGELRKALCNGITAPWEMAEYFGVSQDFVMSACEYYTNACGSIMERQAQ